MIDSVNENCGSDRQLTKSLIASTLRPASADPALAARSARYIGPEMPPSLRTRQKWTAIRNAATSGIPTQCST